MKFLADMNMSMSAVQYLRSRGFDTVHLCEEGLERSSDASIILKAQVENRIILTFDLDFGDLMANSREQLPSVVIFRLHDESPKAVLPHLEDILANYDKELQEGALIIAGNNRNRLRRLPLLYQEE